MKRHTIIYIALFSLAACTKPAGTELYNPDESLKTTGEVTLCLSLENLQTKLSVDSLGYLMFKTGDSVAVQCNDGSFVNFALEGTGDTKRAFFKGTIPEGKEIGEAVVFPATIAQRCYKGVVTLRLPEYRDFSDESFRAPLVGKIGSDFYVKMYQIASYTRVKVSNISPVASAVGFSAGEQMLCGYYDYDISSLGKEGLSLKSGIKPDPVVFNMETVPSEAYFMIPVPVGTVSCLKFVTYDADGNIADTETVAEGLSFVRGVAANYSFKSSARVEGKFLSVSGLKAMAMKESSTGIWEAEFTSPGEASITISDDGVNYGFCNYSGAGGVGECHNLRSALPYYNFTESHLDFYSVGKAAGQVGELGEEASEFWLNNTPGTKMRFVYDTVSGDKPRYYISEVTTDASLIFDEQFDLFTCGGDANFYIAGSSYGDIATYDGYSPATMNGSKWNATADGNSMWDYPTAVKSKTAGEAFIKAREVEGWTFARVGERPGAIQLNQGSNYDSYVQTPAFSAISGTADAEVTLQICRFSNTSLSDIIVEITGGGAFTSGKVSQTAYTLKSGAISPAIENTYDTLSGNTFAIGTDYCVAPPWNNSIDKPVSTFVFNVSGLTSGSQIKISAPFVTDNPPRAMLFGIKVTRK